MATTVFWEEWHSSHRLSRGSTLSDAAHEFFNVSDGMGTFWAISRLCQSESFRVWSLCHVVSGSCRFLENVHWASKVCERQILLSGKFAWGVLRLATKPILYRARVKYLVRYLWFPWPSLQMYHTMRYASFSSLLIRINENFKHRTRQHLAVTNSLASCITSDSLSTRTK